MRSYEFIPESTQPSNKILTWYKNNGYAFVGSGDAAHVFKKGNSVFKVYGPGVIWTTKGTELTGDNDDQILALDYYAFCKKNESNPYLPKFKGYRYLDAEKSHLEIECEILAPGGQLSRAVAELLQELRSFDETVESFKENNPEAYNLINSKIGPNGIELLSRTWSEIMEIGNENGYSTYDMNFENILVRGGIPVINDPWTLG